MKTRFFDPPLPRLIAHRGFSGRYPENTLPAFQAAVDMGSRYLELDIWLTRDNHLVVHHDKSCQRTCNNSIPLPASSIDELKSLDAGWSFSPDGGETFPFRGRGIRIPTLEEVLSAYPETLFTIEVKHDAPAIETVLLETVRRCGKEDAVLIASAIDPLIQRIRRHCRNIPTGFSHDETAAFFSALRRGVVPDSPAGDVLHLPMFYDNLSLISSRLVQAAHSMDTEIHVWTINQRIEMEKLLLLEVDGIVGDFPDILLEVTQLFQAESG